MAEEKKDKECYGSSSEKGCGCCCGNKIVAKIVIALLIFGVGFWVGKGSQCNFAKVCPISGIPMQVQQQR